MNYKLILKLIGNTLKIEAFFMIFPVIVSLCYGKEDYISFLWSIPILLLTGSLLTQFKPLNTDFRPKDAFAAVALSWFFMSLFGALPFYFSGYFNGITDCIFESISGFTTTGSSILGNVEILPEGIMFWRCFSHWIGGMGVLVFMMAVMPSMNASSVNLLRAESTGPSPEKIVPKIRETAKIMYFIYFTMTVLLVILLKLAGLPLYDSLINSFSVAGTGGFSDMNMSIAAYNNPAAEIIITIFMFLFGISFSLYFVLLGGNIKRFLKDEELRFFTGIVITSTLIITFNIAGLYDGITEALRHASFQVSSIISTTGFSTTDFNLWPALSQNILLLLMITGCCGGSTGGGIKLIRILLLLKAARVGIRKVFHPGSVEPVTINKKRISGDILEKTALFFFIYFAIFGISIILISIENRDIITSTTSVISSLSNIGPGLNAVGPTGNYAFFSSFSKMVLSFCMIAGRLEFFPVLLLFAPSAWFNKSVHTTVKPTKKTSRRM